MAYNKPGHILLPTWHQFRRVEPTYEFNVTAMRKIRKLVVDPHNLLMDIDRRNNQSGFFWPTEVCLDNLLYDRTPVNKYSLRLRPDLWYDEPNGTQAGFHAHGSYLETEAKFSLDVRVGTKSGRPTVDIALSSPLRPFGARSIASQRILRADHRTHISTVYEKLFKTWYSRPDRTLFRLQIDYSHVSGNQDNRLELFPEDVREYLPDPTWDASETYYVRLTSGWMKTFRYGSYHFHNREAIGSYEENDRYRAFMESQFLFGVDLTSRSRTFLSLSLEYLATNGEPPSHYLHHLSRVRSIDRFTRSSVFRSPGTFPADWENDFYLANGRVRGYQDRTFYMTDFVGGSLEMTPPDLLPYRWLKIIPLVGGWLSKTDQTLFADGGWVSFGDKEHAYPEPVASNETILYDDDWTFVFSSGVSVSLPDFWRKHRVRVDFPLYLNKPKPDEEEFEFRVSVTWLLPPEI